MDDTITFPGATSVEWEGDTYTADPFGRFSVPGPAQAALVAAGWHIWTPADAPEFGPWVPLLPTISEATDGDLFPCFVDIEGGGFGFPAGLAYRTIGARQVQIQGSAIYMTGPTFPDDVEAPPYGALIAALPDALMYDGRLPLSLGVTINLEGGSPVLAGVNVAVVDADYGVWASGWSQGVGLMTNTLWTVVE